MPNSGLFITLNDRDALNLYLEKRVYGVLRPPVFRKVGSHSRHYGALADFACAREGSHVFFFGKRRIVYGGQIIGSKNYGSYYLNGPYSPEGRKADAPICWDESNRKEYESTDKPGIFKVKTRQGIEERCQPYLIRFTDEIGIGGKSIISDDLYAELSFYPYSLPSNSIRNMSFCTLTPYETNTLIDLFTENSEDYFENPADKIDLKEEPILFNPSLGISKLSEVTSKLHFEASVLSNPDLLPPELRPDSATICRKLPISPHKPSQVDRADICYFTDEPIKNGTIPNKLIDLDWKKANEDKILNIVRYVKWLKRVIPEEYSNISFYLFAPSFKQNIKRVIPKEFSNLIKLIKW